MLRLPPPTAVGGAGGAIPCTALARQRKGNKLVTKPNRGHLTSFLKIPAVPGLESETRDTSRDLQHEYLALGFNLLYNLRFDVL